MDQEQKKVKIYISGRITGDYTAREKFRQAKDYLNGMRNVEAINPFDIAEKEGLEDGATWADYMRADIKALMDADFIYMLRDWRHSRGARLERKLAKALGIKILRQTKGEIRIAKYQWELGK